VTGEIWRWQKKIYKFQIFLNRQNYLFIYNLQEGDNTIVTAFLILREINGKYERMNDIS
jgi:hypothetical protein